MGKKQDSVGTLKTVGILLGRLKKEEESRDEDRGGA